MVLSKFASFGRMMYKHVGPYALAAAQAGTLMAAGDLLSQGVIEKKEKFDYGRTIRFGMVGLVFVGPGLRLWYGSLERFIKLKTPGATALAKMGVDQGLFAPLFILNFIFIMGALNDNSLPDIMRSVSNDYFDILIANYKIWPAAQMINFYLVPLSKRVLFAQTIALFWNTYLSWKTNQTESEKTIGIFLNTHVQDKEHEHEHQNTNNF